MTRRFFASIFASVTAASTRAVAFTKETILRRPAHQQVIVFQDFPSAIRSNLWFRIRHEDGVRFVIGAPKEDPVASGMIAPTRESAIGRDYGVLSVKGLRSSIPLQVTFSSRKPFSLLGYQEVFDRPYAVRSEGTYGSNFIYSQPKYEGPETDPEVIRVILATGVVPRRPAGFHPPKQDQNQKEIC